MWTYRICSFINGSTRSKAVEWSGKLFRVFRVYVRQRWSNFIFLFSFVPVLFIQCLPESFIFQWDLGDLACQMYSMISVPIYDTHGAEGCVYIINHGKESWQPSNSVSFVHRDGAIDAKQSGYPIPKHKVKKECSPKIRRVGKNQTVFKIPYIQPLNECA